MGHSRVRSRPIVGSVTGTGEQIVVVDQFQDDTVVQLIANGGTATVEYTVENVLYDSAAQAAVNVGGYQAEADRYVDPASANWVSLTVTSGIAQVNAPIFAIRINVTVAGTPNVRYIIAQG